MTTTTDSRQVPLEALHPADWNPRTISTERFKNLCASIQADPDFLRLRPILARGDGTIYAGNMRYRAAEHLKHPTVWAVIEDVPDKLARERAIRDNQQWGEWQDDELAELLAGLHEAGSALDILGLEQDDVDRLLESVGIGGEQLNDDDADLTPPADPITKPGDLWLLGDHRLLCGDATKADDVARLMNGERPDVLICDPPYGISLDTNYAEMPKTTRGFAPIHGDHEAFDAGPVRGWWADVAEQFWFGANYYARSLGDTEHGGAWLVWDKRVDENYDAGFGSGFELLWSQARRQQRILRFQWFQNHADDAQEAQSREHPTQKPTALYDHLLELSTSGGGLAVDPFLGSGTTLIAAEQLGRRCYALEIEPAYCDVSVRRWEHVTGRKAERG